jgi:hypothetical protein
MPRWEQIEKNSEFVVKTPFMMISNEYFQSETKPKRNHFDDWKIVCKFYKDSCNAQDDEEGKKNFNIVLKNSYHLAQFDWALHDGYLLKIFKEIGFRCDVMKKQKETCEHILRMIRVEQK